MPLEMIRRAVRIAMVLAATSEAAAGQSLSASVDPTIARVQQRAVAGDSAGARGILDSLLASKLDNDASRAEVVYWLARFGASSSDREHALTTLIVDHPFSPRVGPALYELAMLEMARSDREKAAVHLARFLASSEVDSNRTTASLTLGRLLFEREESSRACAVLLAGRAELAPTAVEVRNQFDFSTTSCRGVDTSVGPPPIDYSLVPTSTGGEYSVQVAAFDLKNQADRLATRLRGLGLEARVIGKKKPFRVRVGHYMTHAEANTASRKIEALSKSKTFVVLIGPEEK